MKDPKALELGEKTVEIIKRNKCLTPKEAANALKDVFFMLKLEVKDLKV
jgi:hypothetical protein